MTDLHTLQDGWGHGKGCLADGAARALERGITLLGVSGHPPRFADAAEHPRPQTQMARSHWDACLAEATVLRDELAGRRGVPIRVGSDDHRREQIGLGWPEARVQLKRLGVDRLVACRDREREEVPLP